MRSAERVVAFYSQRGTAEQWIKEGKGAIKWTRLSCRSFAANAVRLQLHVLAYSCGRRPHQREGAGSDYDKRRRKRCALSQGKQRVLSLQGSQLRFRPGLALHGAR